MKQLIYLSTAVHLMKNEELVDILKSSRENNSRNGVSGILLYSGGTFIQVLEGDEMQVDKTFERIAFDERHRNIMTLIELPTQSRDFAEWSMGFTELNGKGLNELEGYLRNPKELLNSHSSAAVTVLKTFIKTNHLVIS